MMAIARRRPAAPPVKLILAGLAAAALGGGWTALHFLAAPEVPANPAVWAAGESRKVAPDAAPDARNAVWSSADRRVRLYGGRQEYVGFQVVVRAGREPLLDVQVHLSSLRSADGAELSVADEDLFLEHYLRVTVPSQNGNDEPVPQNATGEFPTQMVPLRGKNASFTVGAGRNQPVWTDLYVPENQKPGDYHGEAVVTAAGRELARLPVELTVWRFTLPRETHLRTAVPTEIEQLRWGFGLKPDQEDEVSALTDRFFQMAHQHRLSFQPGEEDDATLEWGGHYQKYLDGTAFRNRAGAGVGVNLLTVGTGGESKDEVAGYARKVKTWWSSQPDAVRKNTELLTYVYDEPHDDEDYAAVAERARWIRGAVGKDLLLFLTSTAPSRVPAGLIDAWGEIPAAEIGKRVAGGQKVWSTNAGYAGGPFVDTPGYSGRSQAWMAWKLGLDGWQFWNGCYWVDRQNITDERGKRLPYKTVNAGIGQLRTDTWSNPLTFDQKRNPRHKDWIRLNGDGVLFYPGTPAGLNEPLASFTMKSLRRGLQDYEYLWLLKQRGISADDVVNRMVPRAGEWSHDPNAWDQARLDLGRKLDSKG